MVFHASTLASGRSASPLDCGLRRWRGEAPGSTQPPGDCHVGADRRGRSADEDLDLRRRL